jgi:DNA-binding transcriptional ArsR family regulator
MNIDAPDLFAAFANPFRLRILNLLQEQKESRVCDLCEVLGELQPKISRHLGILRDSPRLTKPSRDWASPSLSVAPKRCRKRPS